ncbi:hypothetical protein [Chryseobacterium caseinilyticum]|uniref:Lipoprotein n=1 Tax=Chryseobacterium caseinilyticum TaxID=2771428 RepID=A0ABR8ZFW8_9FLAO|nr:hypothetical protein [Chryseobacterium caseinilyticum]MBD8084197.1 hypothetical protein [Chryseobacterium caseinilyticum]
MKNYQMTIFCLMLAMSSCKGQKSNSEKYITEIQKNEAAHLDKIYKAAGELISEINFELSATDEQKADWPEGIIPWISVENPQDEISQLINPNEIVIKENKINLLIDYPLKKPAKIELSNPNGFTRKDLILEISNNYHKIYAEEETTAKIKTIPLEKRTDLINRNETNGKYGIWGHDLADLDLSGIEVHQTTDGKINLILIIES